MLSASVEKRNQRQKTEHQVKKPPHPPSGHPLPRGERGKPRVIRSKIYGCEKCGLGGLERRAPSDPGAVVTLYRYFTEYDDEVAGAILRQLLIGNFIFCVKNRNTGSGNDALAALYVLDQCENPVVRDRINEVPIASFVESERCAKEAEKTEQGRRALHRSRDGLAILAYLGNQEAINHENVGSRQPKAPSVSFGSGFILPRKSILEMHDREEIAARDLASKGAQQAAREPMITVDYRADGLQRDALPPPPSQGGGFSGSADVDKTFFLPPPRPVVPKKR